MAHDKSQVIDFNEVRQQKMDEKRRKTERIFFQHLLGVYTVSDGSQMRSIEILEVSEEGLSFQVPFDAQTPWPTDAEDIALRLYFSQDTYLPIRVRVQHTRPSIDNGRKYTRYGCRIDSSLSSYPAWQQFVRFLAAYSEHAHKDKGDVSVFYL